MSLGATSLRFLNASGDRDSVGSLFQCLTTLSEKKCFLVSSLNLSWPSLRPFPLALLLLPGRRGQPPPHHNLLSEAAAMRWGVPAAKAQQPDTAATE